MSNKILIEDIEREPNKTLHYEFDDEIKELEGCRLRADLEIKSLGGFIEVKGEASGVVTLECDRCLNKFEYDLEFDIDETYAKHSLYDEYSQEVELQSGQFITDLNGAKEIDLYDLLYQSVMRDYLCLKKIWKFTMTEWMCLKTSKLINPNSTILERMKP